MSSTLTDVFSLIDQLPGNTSAEKALLDFKLALTELANGDSLRGARISIGFGDRGHLHELNVTTRLDMPIKRVARKT